MLPWASKPEDEFLHPSGEWWLTCRAIVTDSWLLWRHALCKDFRQWHLLDKDVSYNIRSVAHRLHLAHVMMPGYRDLGDTPFAVSVWWDPFHSVPAHAEGRQCVFRLSEGDPVQFVSFCKEFSDLTTALLSDGWIQATLNHVSSDQSI